VKSGQFQGAGAQVMQRPSQKNDDAYKKALQSGSIADLFMLAADDHELSQAAAVLERDGNRGARSLFASLIESHEINRVPPNQYDNARRRERLNEDAIRGRVRAGVNDGCHASARS
jgi:hypothetical protein